MPEGRHDALRSLRLNSRVLPHSLTCCRFSGVGSFCLCGSPSTDTSLFISIAELPAPPAPVGPVEIPKEPVAGAVPAGVFRLRILSLMAFCKMPVLALC